MEDLREGFSDSSSSYLSLPSLVPHPLQMDMELWLMAEQRTQEILCAIQPALVSDRSRQEIIDYVRILIKAHHGIEVFMFGSVPLKTYLPDGDIDLTVLTHKNVEEELAQELCTLLEGEGGDSEFEIRDVQYIPAQVKVIKCNIRNIAVDISFNQMAGLCALCFLEQVDKLTAKDHLFKRSIILIKAWCYYESRILGANTGLISTYALTVLVLHIINVFHSSLCGPLAVLYKFLDYYSVFDWDRYCVSINGPIAISSLPEISVVNPENDGQELLLSQEFLIWCRELYSAPTKAVETNGHDFPVKHLNIIDPLKDSNNLGRSVTKGNFQRIKHALSLGAQKLREIFMLPGETMGANLENFFVNTLDRNGKGEREDVHAPVTAFGTGRSEAYELSGDIDGYFRSIVYGQWYHGYMLPGMTQPSHPPSTSQIQDRRGWDIVRWHVNCQWNEFYWSSQNVLTPMLPYSHPYMSQLTSPSLSFPNMGKSRGTGPYIPDMNHHSYSYYHGNPGTSDPIFPTHGPLLESSGQTGQVEVSPGTSNRETGDSLEPLQEEFSSHLRIEEESMPSDPCCLDQQTVNSLQSECCCSSSDSSTMNGTDGSLSGHTTSPAKRADSTTSTFSSGSDEEKHGSS